MKKIKRKNIIKHILRGKATVKNILEAAAFCFAEKGYDKTDINEICRRANLTKGAFYHHFSSKQELFKKMMEQWISKLAEQIDLNEFKSRNTMELLLDIPGKLKPAFEEVDKQLPIFLELFIKATTDKELNKIAMKSYNEFINFFRGIIKRGINEGSIKKVDPDDAAKVLFSLTIGLVMQGLLNPDAEDWEKLAKKSILMILK